MKQPINLIEFDQNEQLRLCSVDRVEFNCVDLNGQK